MSAVRLQPARNAINAIPGVDAAGAVAFMRRAGLAAAVGIELAVLWAFAPDTLARGWNGPPGDFSTLYRSGIALELNGMYNPVITPLIYPMHWLGELNAYRLLFALNVVSVLAIAFVAQRYVAGAGVRIAVALAVVSFPQLHWALRLGHLTPLLALSALIGLTALERRPRAAGLVLSLLSFKPQYAIAPFLFLLRGRRLRIAALMLGASAVMACAGFAAIGPASVRDYISLYLDWGPNSADNLLPIQQSWLYSWPGVQISLGVEPNPGITFALLLLSLAVVVLAWMRTDAGTGACVTAFAMLLLTPYSQFYDAGLLVAGIALLIRCQLNAAMTTAAVASLYVAALVTQANTIYPASDLLQPARTEGIYWLTPAVLAVVAGLAIHGASASRKEASRGD